MNPVLNGQISIGRVRSSDDSRDNLIKIEIEDNVSGILFTTVEMTPEAFAMVLTGLSGVPVNISTNGLDKVGKVRESKNLQIHISKETLESTKICSFDKDALSKYIKENQDLYVESGWELSAYLGRQSSIATDRETGGVILNVTQYRYV